MRSAVAVDAADTRELSILPCDGVVVQALNQPGLSSLKQGMTGDKVQLVKAVVRASAALAETDRSPQASEADKTLAFNRLKLVISRARNRGCFNPEAGVIA